MTSITITFSTELNKKIIRAMKQKGFFPHEKAGLIHNALTNSSNNDVYTNQTFNIFSLTIAEDGEIILKKWDFTKEQIGEKIIGKVKDDAK